MFELFANAGGNFIDTAVNYTGGTSEEYVGELIHAERDHFVVASKYSLTRSESNDPNGGGNSRKNMMKSVEASLRHLKTDHIDLYYLHMWDYMTPVDEVMRGLDDLVRSGKVVYIGISDTPDWIVAEANTLASLHGWSRFIGYQVPYSLLDRAVERSIMPAARHWQMAVLPWGILEIGILTGKFQEKVGDPTRLKPDRLDLSEKSLQVIQELKQVAGEAGRPMSQAAINWVRQRPDNQMIPILGARNVKQLADNLAAVEWNLTPEQIQRLDQVSAIDMGFPHDFLLGNRNIYGTTFDLIDDRHW